MKFVVVFVTIFSCHDFDQGKVDAHPLGTRAVIEQLCKFAFKSIY